jgi:hypothetical protein
MVIRLMHVGLGLAFILGMQCTSSDRARQNANIRPPEMNNPYFQSFRNRGIKYILFEHMPATSASPDTIELDQFGNVIKITGPYERENRDYDRNGYLVRRLVRSDFTVHCLARYSAHGDTLIQSWREFESRDWDLRGDTTTKQREVNFFIFDERGRIILESKDGFGPLNYVYSGDKLLSKEVEIKRENDDQFHTIKVAEFTYDAAGDLTKIRYADGEQREDIFYYSHGILDSCEQIRKGFMGALRDRYRCRYIYNSD